LDQSAVEVLVTSGRVELMSPDVQPDRSGSAPHPSVPPVLEARQRAVVSLTVIGGPPQIATLTRGEIERVLAWQHRLLDFTDAPLHEITAEFNRRNDVQIVVVGPELARMRMSATIRSDNVEGFVRLVEAGFGAHA